MGGVVLIVVAAISFGLTVQCCKGCMLYMYMILLPVVLYSKYDVVVGVSDSLAAQHDKVIFSYDRQAPLLILLAKYW